MTPGRRYAWTPGDLAPDVAQAMRVLIVLAAVGAAVLITGQIMSKAQTPARRILGV